MSGRCGGLDPVAALESLYGWPLAVVLVAVVVGVVALAWAVTR